jgi:hypothetical protein
MKKVIKDNLITSVTASSEDSAYPASNLLDDRPNWMWKAGSGITHASLTCALSSASEGAAGGIAIYGTNATKVIINIEDPNAITFADIVWDGLEWPSVSPETLPEIDSSGSSQAIWSEYARADNSLNAVIILEGDSTLEAQIVVAGEMLEFRNPMYDNTEGLKDNSIEKDYLNGSFYYKKKTIVRTFSGVMNLERDDDGFYSFMLDFAREYGKAPKAMRLTNQAGFRWVVYARFESLPAGQHGQALSSVNYQLIEVVS